MRLYFFAAILCGAALSAHGEFADYRFIPPSKGAGDAVKATAAMANEAIAKMKGGAMPHYQIDDYAGQKAALRKASTHPELQVAVGADLGWASEQLFEKPERQNGRYVWRAAISSVDATALRLNVDLAGLGADDEVWVVDDVGAVAFGPYTLADTEGEGRWLPTTMGDTSILVVESPQADLPQFTVRSLSHFYEDLVAKGTDCPISADCITDTALQEISTGIGRLLVTDDDAHGALCTGALLNNAVTEDLEGLFLTADHCFHDFPATIHASGLEVIWDVRTNGCPGAEPSASEIAQKPRSTGAAFLRNSTTLDIMLFSLASVPVGDLGRAYLGWDTVAPAIGNASVGIHHPFGTALKESIGSVENINVNSQFGEAQTTQRWTEGITEKGSSGSPVMFNDGKYRVFGVLSNGNNQSCSNNNARRDQYSSFQAFFTSAGGFLNLATPPDAGRATYIKNGDVGGGDGLQCQLVARSFKGAAGDLALAGMAVLTMLALGTPEHRRG